MTGNPCWQAIPTKLSEAQFEEFVLPHLSRGRRGPAPTLSLHKIFNYILCKYCTWAANGRCCRSKGMQKVCLSGHKHLKGCKVVAFCDRDCNIIAPFVTRAF